MAKGDWFFKFEIPPWRKPKVRSCSLATRGFWLECIAIMHESGKAVMTGTYEEFAKVTGCFPDEAKACIDDLKRYKTADVTLRNEIVTLKSRKYARELKAKELTRLRVANHRKNKDVTPEKRLSERRKEKLETKEEEKKSETLPAPAPAKRVPKLTRIPDPFPITPEMWAWLSENVQGLEDPNFAHERFVEHWTNAPPGKAEKVNWNLTWQNGMKLAKKWQDEDNRNGSDKRNSKPDRRTDADILRDSAEQIASRYSN